MRGPGQAQRGCAGCRARASTCPRASARPRASTRPRASASRLARRLAVGAERDRGSITLMLAALGGALIALAGIVIDGGTKLRAAENANAVAQEAARARSEEHTSELQSRENLVCRLLL